MPLYRARGWDIGNPSNVEPAVGQLEVHSLLTSGKDSVPNTVNILSLELNGILNSEMKHLIKRYLRKIGFLNVRVVHLSDGGPSTLTLSVTGQVSHEPTDEQRMKLNVLNEALMYALTHPKAGLDPHPSHADPEVLRRALVETEPSMENTYYTRA